MPPRPVGWSLLVALLSLSAPAALMGQTVSGHLLEPGSSRPIAGALVVLLDSSGKEVAGALTDASGAYTVRAPGSGSFRLRAQRVAYQSVVSPAFELRDGQTVSRDLVAATIPTRIEGLTVDARNPCEIRPGAGRKSAQLWEEVRKALDAAAFTQRESLYRFQVRTFSRKLDPESLRPLPDSAVEHERTAVLDRPFRSAPVERLLQDGFVQTGADETVYYAPDAEVLLSDAFLDEYCFAIATSGSDSSLVGLAFRPVAKRGPPALRGTLWLDRATRALRYLDYGYARYSLPGGLASAAAGRIEFEELPTGAWIVRRWTIRMPTQLTLTTETPGGSNTIGCGPGCFSTRTGIVTSRGAVPVTVPKLTGLREDGGEVIAIIPLRGGTLPASEPVR
jgi:hypothetical protein